MVGPEVHHHFQQLALAVPLTQDGGRDQFLCGFGQLRILHTLGWRHAQRLEIAHQLIGGVIGDILGMQLFIDNASRPMLLTLSTMAGVAPKVMR